MSMGPTWRVVIADDEPLARRTLRDLLAERGGFELVGECRTGNEVIAAVDRLGPDLLFLDVAMPDLDGMTALRSLGTERRPFVVMVTAFEEYALPAHRDEVLDYLVKPFSDERFDLTVERARRRLAERTTPPPRYRTRFLGMVGRRSVPVPVAEVDWIEARSYCARIHAGDRQLVVRRSLTRMESELDPALFARIHRRAIVNLTRVVEVRSDERGQRSVLLTSGRTIPVSERRIAALLAALG